MKKCKNCGALMSDDKTVCIDCGARLGAPLSDAEEKEESSKLGMQLDDLYESAYQFVPSRFNKVLGIISAVLAVFMIVTFVIAQTKWHKAEDANLSAMRQEFEKLIAGEENDVFPISTVGAGYIPSVSGMYNTIAKVSLFGLPFSILAAVMFLAPSLEWKIRRWELNLAYDTEGEIRPSWISVKLMRGMIYFSFAVSVVCAAVVMAMFIMIFI